MENQHRKIKGYRELTQEEVDLMNRIKEKGAELGILLGEVQAYLSRQVVAALNLEKDGNRDEVFRLDEAQPQRWLAIGRTDFQTALMAATRAVAQPTFF